MIGINRSLLDHLSEHLRCMYLSDLRRPDLKQALCRELRAVPSNRYPARQWADALFYLTGVWLEYPAAPEELKGELLALLDGAKSAVTAPSR